MLPLIHSVGIMSDSLLGHKRFSQLWPSFFRLDTVSSLYVPCFSCNKQPIFFPSPTSLSPPQQVFKTPSWLPRCLTSISHIDISLIYQMCKSDSIINVILPVQQRVPITPIIMSRLPNAVYKCPLPLQMQLMVFFLMLPSSCPCYAAPSVRSLSLPYLWWLNLT